MYKIVMNVDNCADGVGADSDDGGADDDNDQTHDKASRFWNRASLFVLATWTLGNHVAPDQEVVKMMMPKMMMIKILFCSTRL